MTYQLRMLTLWEPWATLVIVGAKPFEFRGNKTPSTIVDQRTVIHAAKKPIDIAECTGMLALLEASDPNAADLCLIAERAIPVLRDAIAGNLRLGVGLGTVVFGEARNGVSIAREHFHADQVDVGDELDANWGWPIADIFAWDEPVPARGGQGIKFWPHGVMRGKPIRYPEGYGIPPAGPR